MPSPLEPALAFTLRDKDAGRRLDQLLGERLPHLSRREVLRCFEEGLVRHGGRRARKGDKATAGNELTLSVAPPSALIADPELPLVVHLETDEFVIVEKPAGVPTVPLGLDARGTLAGALAARWPEMRGVGHGPREPGVVHRLDTGTSGLVLAARTAAAFERLTAALQSGALEKRYLAVVPAAACPPHGENALPLRSAGTRVVVAELSERGARAAHTRFERLEPPFPGDEPTSEGGGSEPEGGGRVGRRWALVEVRAARAFRHQVRVHLADLGLPLANDTLYGGEPVPGWGQRHALHASWLAGAAAATGIDFTVKAPLPDDLRALLEE